MQDTSKPISGALLRTIVGIGIFESDVLDVKGAGVKLENLNNAEIEG